MKVQEGDAIKVGQLLVTFDKDAIEKEGYCTEIPVVITNTDDFLDVVTLDQGRHAHGEDILKVI